MGKGEAGKSWVQRFHDREFMEIQEAFCEGDLELLEVVRLEDPGFIGGFDDHGFAWFHTALSIGTDEVVEWFYLHGAGPHVRGEHGTTALCELIDSKADARLDRVRRLIDEGADVNEFSLSYAPLHVAVNVGAVECCRLLLASGADPDLRAEIDDFWTAREFASFRGHPDIEPMLRDAPALPQS